MRQLKCILVFIVTVYIGRVVQIMDIYDEYREYYMYCYLTKQVVFAAILTKSKMGRPSGVVCYLVVLPRYLVAHPDLVPRTDTGKFPDPSFRSV